MSEKPLVQEGDSYAGALWRDRHLAIPKVTNGRIIARGSPRQVLGPYGRAYAPTGHLGDRNPLASGEGTTSMVLKIFAVKMAQVRPKSGLDWLMCSKIAGQRPPHDA